MAKLTTSMLHQMYPHFVSTDGSSRYTRIWLIIRGPENWRRFAKIAKAAENTNVQVRRSLKTVQVLDLEF